MLAEGETLLRMNGPLLGFLVTCQASQVMHSEKSQRGILHSEVTTQISTIATNSVQYLFHKYETSNIVIKKHI